MTFRLEGWKPGDRDVGGGVFLRKCGKCGEEFVAGVGSRIENFKLCPDCRPHQERVGAALDAMEMMGLASTLWASGMSTPAD